MSLIQPVLYPDGYFIPPTPFTLLYTSRNAPQQHLNMSTIPPQIPHIKIITKIQNQDHNLM